MIVVQCYTRSWYMYAFTNLYALFKNNDVEKVYLFIEDNEIPNLKDDRIVFINLNKIPRYVKCYSPNYNTKYTLMTMVRCYFSKVLNEDKILYLDADCIVDGNIQELWDMDLEGNVVTGTKEPGEWSKHLGMEGMDNKYINSGIMIMDLKAIREQGLDDKMLDLLHRNYYFLPDQDVLNIVCKDKIKYVSSIYNSTETTGFVDNAKIVHYIRERKGWIRTSPRSEIWFKYFKEMLGGKMIRVEVTEEFTLGRFNELKNIQRKGRNETGRLFRGDTFECTEEMADYLSGNNGLKKAFIKVIEILPKEDISPKDTIQESEKVIPLEEEKNEKVAEEILKVTKPKKKTGKK